jgi:hypothetical protein
VVLSTIEIFGPWADLTSVSTHLDESLLVVIELFTILFAALFVAVVTANCAQSITSALDRLAKNYANTINADVYMYIFLSCCKIM